MGHEETYDLNASKHMYHYMSNVYVIICLYIY